MRVIAVKTLKEYWEMYPQAEQALWTWYEEVGTLPCSQTDTIGSYQVPD
jgi:mRNA-degrading endonuclease HigB of HigAB toxin-antitoxin module